MKNSIDSLASISRRPMFFFPSNYAGIHNLVLLGDHHIANNSTSYSSRTYVVLFDFKVSLLKSCAALATVQIGPYYAQNCKSNNNKLATLLSTLSNTLQPVITDLGSSISSDAYTTFFKDIAHAPYVRDVFYNITTGVSVPPEPGAQSSTPVFICVDGRDQVSYRENGKRVDVYTRCRALGEVPAIALLKSPYIVICPFFFTLPSIPAQSTSTCLTVDSYRTRFVQNGKSLVKYQLWHVLHELVHYYVYATVQDHMDIYNINACLALKAKNAVLNAQSYVYYAASKYIGLAFRAFAVAASCVLADGRWQMSDWDARIFRSCGLGRRVEGVALSCCRQMRMGQCLKRMRVLRWWFKMCRFMQCLQCRLPDFGS